MTAIWITALLFAGCDPASDQDTDALVEADDTASAGEDTDERTGMEDTAPSDDTASSDDTAGGADDTAGGADDTAGGDTSDAETAPQSLVTMVALPAGTFTMGSPKDEVEREQDEAQFENAMTFDITRPNLKSHVAFGKGIHHCLGAALARREMNGGFQVIFERLENFRIEPGKPRPDFMPNALLHGLERLDLAFDVRA